MFLCLKLAREWNVHGGCSWSQTLPLTLHHVEIWDARCACVCVRECLFMRLWVDVLLLSFFVANSLQFAPLDFIRWFHLPNLSNLWFIASPACVLFLVTRRDVITLRLCHVLSAPLAFSIHRERWISALRHPYPLSDFVLFPGKHTVQVTSHLWANGDLMWNQMCGTKFNPNTVVPKPVNTY